MPDSSAGIKQDIIYIRPPPNESPYSSVRRAVTTLLCLSFIFPLAARIDRLDMYDRADNHLLFVTFDYDGTGKCTGRSVFTSDSTFLRSTTFQVDGAGVSVRENSVDFKNDPLFTTAFSAQSGKTGFNVTDQFGLHQLGGPMGWSLSGQNSYEITQGMTVIYRMVYQYDAVGALARINVADQAGGPAYYALVNANLAAPERSFSRAGRLLFRGGHDGRVQASFTLAKSGRIVVEMYTPSGRRVATVADRMYEAGTHAFTVNPFRADGTCFGDGAYFLRMSSNGTTVRTCRFVFNR
jgi:hypothetical protein